MIKRLFDFTAATGGLFVALPLMIFIAVWIKMDSKGPVFYRPLRGGQYGKPFRIFKFRSMVVDADKIGGPSTSGDDARVTKSGRFIRKCKLDEISQLINVALGQMSLVGPRPDIVSKVEQFSGEEKKILELKPGITDWASIWNSDEGGVLEGASDPDAVYEVVIRPIKRDLQLYYYYNRSFWGDIKIIFSTLRRIMDKNGMPKELEGYPGFKELRTEALRVIKQQKRQK
jgi:lipopolysaccharide/colanic/teichoic acid biosynthesis glycosyltransferase